VDPAAVFNLAPARLRKRPFEHVVVPDFIAPDVYANLVEIFPTCPPSTGPTGYSCYWGDATYDSLVAGNPAWHALFEATHSQRFIDYCVRSFAPVFARRGCAIDVRKATYVGYRETREDKERRHILKPVHAPHELWVRTDIHQGQIGYRRARHLDHRRRLVSMLIYLCDADANAMQGGDLVLHRRPGSWLAGRDAVVRPRHNLMTAFACHAFSHHSVPPIVSQSAPRNFVQITVSSSIDSWPVTD
jgi:hypothetical protein